MAGASAALAIATLAGHVSGRLAVAAPAAARDLLPGRRQPPPRSVAAARSSGTQSLIAFIVFGRFPENVPHALA